MATQTEKIIDLLSDGEWHTNIELNTIAYRYGGRLHDYARAMGYDSTDDVFENVQVDKGLFRYRIRPEMLDKIRGISRPPGRCWHTAHLRKTKQGELL